MVPSYVFLSDNPLPIGSLGVKQKKIYGVGLPEKPLRFGFVLKKHLELFFFGGVLHVGGLGWVSLSNVSHFWRTWAEDMCQFRPPGSSLANSGEAHLRAGCVLVAMM